MFLRKKIFSFRSYSRRFFIALSFLIAIQPMMTVAQDLSIEQQQQMLHYLQQMMRRSGHNQSQAEIVALAVGPLPCMQNIQSIIGRNEQDELQIDSLIRSIDRTKTDFGSNVMRQIGPVDDMAVIKKRQDQIKVLLADEKLFVSVERQLERIKRAQDSILKYGDDSQYENATSLFFRSRSLYFGVLSRFFGDKINQNKLSLELSHAIEASNIGLRLIALIGLEGVKWEFAEWMYREDAKLDLGKAFADGFRANINLISLRRSEKKTLKAQSFREICTKGTPRDVWDATFYNHNDKSSVKFPFIGEWKITNESRFDKPMGILGKLGYGSWATACTAAIIGWRIKGLYEEVQSTGQRVISFTKTMKELHVHMVHVARAIDAMRKLASIVREHEVLSKSCFAEHMRETIENPSSQLEKLFDLLQQDTFTLKKAKSQLYSRGNVLLAHRLCGVVRDEMRPLLQAVGELDAVYAMACNMKEHQDSDTPFSFVEFVPEVAATIDVEQAWLPMVKNPVANTIMFGGADNPNKMIITGPNGGGKSVFLKTLGCCVALAQSWGIVPAKSARMSLFNGIRTCIHPQESLEHELSTFMAEKMRIDSIKQYVFQNNKPGFKTLLLLDEPFKGTVDSESADRIYDFGKEIAELQGLLVGIATHVEKPINLAADTGAYTNYHVRIRELEGGRFERDFTLEPGILRWWFDDPNKRSKFIDFVTLEKHKEQLAASSV